MLFSIYKAMCEVWDILLGTEANSAVADVLEAEGCVQPLSPLPWSAE